MKKTIFILLLLCVFLTGCTFGQQNQANTSPNNGAPLGGSVAGQSVELSDSYQEKVYEDTNYKASFLISETFINEDALQLYFEATTDYTLAELKLNIENYLKSNDQESADYTFNNDLSYMTGSNSDGAISNICIYGEKSDYCFHVLLSTQGSFSQDDLEIITKTLESFEFDVIAPTAGGPLTAPSGSQPGFDEATHLVTYEYNGIQYSFTLSKSFEFTDYNDNNGMIFDSSDNFFSIEILCFNGGYTSLDNFYEHTAFHTWPVTEDKGEFYDNSGRLVRYYLVSYNPSSADGIYQLEFVDHGCGYVIYLSAEADIPQYAIDYMNELINDNNSFSTVVSSTNNNTSDPSNNGNSSLEIPADAIRVAGTNAYFDYPGGMGGFDEEITVSGLNFSEQTAGAQIAVFSNATLPSFAGTDFNNEVNTYYQAISNQSTADIFNSGNTQINGMDAFYVSYALDEGSFYSYHVDFIIDSYMGSTPVFLAKISTSIDYFFDSDYAVLGSVADYFYPIY